MDQLDSDRASVDASGVETQANSPPTKRQLAPWQRPDISVISVYAAEHTLAGSGADNVIYS